MLPRRSSSTARPAERPFLAPIWLIALLAAIIGIVMFLIYPQQDLERRIASAPDSAISTAYLDNLLRSDPDNPRLRLLLARRQLQSGDTGKARATLQPALDSNDPELHREALWVLWELSEIDFSRLPATASAQRRQLREEQRRQLRTLINEQWPADRQMALASKAFQLEERALGAELFQKLANAIDDPSKAAALFEQAAAQALAIGDYRGCAELFILARNKTPDAAKARRHFHSAVKALQSGNQMLAALELGEREIGVLADDPETLFMMTNLARAAGQPGIAERYIRRLLQLSLNHQWQLLQIARAWGDGNFRPVSQNSPAREPGLAFDDKVYTLGYEVFLENRKIEDAWQIASAAVRQAPDNMAWRERLARVSEWTSRQPIALANWLKIAQSSQSDEAWQGVLRLAPGLFDDSALIPALRYQLARQPNDLRLIRELVAAYERLGDPRPAIAYLESQTRHQARPETLELLAELAERAAQPELALATWERLFANPAQVTAPRALRVAILYLQQGKGAAGLKWLEQAQATASLSSDSDIEYWRLTGQLAETLQKDEQAIHAFRRLVDADKATSGDYDTLIRLLNSNHPLEAARIATQAWQRFDEARHLILAMTLYAARNRWDEVGILLRQLDPAPDAARRSLRRLQALPEFLRLTGIYQQNTGRLADARRNFEAGLRLAPNASEMQQALLWLLIDSNDAVALRKLLASNELKWRQNPALHDTLASAYQALSLPQVALQRYLTAQVATHQNDFLWLMNYADALDQNQQSDRAWRLRRHLLSQEWQAARGQDQLSHDDARRRWLTDAGQDQTRRIARTRLLLTQRPGDVGLDALREMLRLDRQSGDNFSNAAAETAIGWLQDSGEYTAERGFLWHQYAKARSSRANRPLWAEITVALAEEDKSATGQLLETFDERLPRYDRVNAARAVDDLRLAQTAAFEAQSDQTDDDPTHLQLTESLLAFSDHAGLASGKRNFGSFDETPIGASYHVAVNPRLSLDFEWGRTQRQARDNNIVREVPNEAVFGGKLTWRHPDGETILRAEQRESFSSYTPLQIEHEQRIDNRLSLRIGLGTQLPSQESLPLRIAGMKDQALVSLRYKPTRLDQIVVAHWRDKYQLQSGGYLGDGKHTSLTVAHTYRQEARDLEFSAFWSDHKFKRKESLDGLSQSDLEVTKYFPENFAPGPDFFLPDNFSFSGLRVSTDVRHEQQYTRATRPYASLARTWHSNLGPGYDIRLGIAGSVLGADHLALSWGIGKSGLQTGGLVRELLLTYRIHH